MPFICNLLTNSTTGRGIANAKMHVLTRLQLLHTKYTLKIFSQVSRGIQLKLLVFPTFNFSHCTTNILSMNLKPAKTVTIYCDYFNRKSVSFVLEFFSSYLYMRVCACNNFNKYSSWTMHVYMVRHKLICFILHP